MNDYKNNLDFMLMQTCRAHHLIAGRELDEVGLHRGQPRLLFALMERDGVKQSQLAKQLGVTPPTITNMVKRMESGGFVVRRRDTEDERVSRVYLTKAGQAILETMKMKMQQINDKAFADFSEDEKAQIRDFFRRVQANLLET